MTKEKGQGVKQPTKHDKVTERLFHVPWAYKEDGFMMWISDSNGNDVLEDSDPYYYQQALHIIVEAVNNYDHLKVTNEKLVEALREMCGICKDMSSTILQKQLRSVWVGDSLVESVISDYEKLLNEIEKGNNNE